MYSARLAIRAAEELQAAGATERARQVLDAALARCRAVSDVECQWEVENALGSCLRGLGERRLAIESHERALELARASGDRRGQAAALVGLGATLRDLGDQRSALARYEEALRLSGQERDAAGEGAALEGMGTVHLDQGRRREALDLYRGALGRYDQVGSRWDPPHPLGGQAAARNNIAVALGELGAHREALAQLQRAVREFEDRGDRRGEAVAFHNLGAVHRDLGEADGAVEHEEVALTLFRSMGDRAGEARAAAALGGFLARVSPARAIFHGKQAVSRYQVLREDLRGLAPTLQATYAETVGGTYRRLASQLAERGRVPEAEEVLALLKSREFFDFIRRDAGAAREDDVPYTPAEERARGRYEVLSERLVAAVRNTAEYRQRLPGYRTEEEEGVFVESERRARRELRAFFRDLDRELGAGRERQVAPPAASELARVLQALGRGHAAILTLVAEEGVRLILVAPDRSVSRLSRLGAGELATAVLDLREALTDPGRDARGPARKVYDAVVGPLAQDLEQAHVRTVIWSLDGVLRYVPMAALFDGEHWLVERFRSVVFPGTPVSALAVEPRAGWTALGLGVTRAYPGFPALPGVRDELDAVVSTGSRKGVLPGEILVDDLFSRAALGRAQEGRRSVVHVASHFLFHPGDETRSYLLLGDGSHLTVGEMRAMPGLFHGIDQVTLSACDTATQGGEGAEIDGLAMVARQQGAGAVLASLWPVADVSTPALMRAYYRERDAGRSGPEALQAAQLSLLLGEAAAGQDWRHPFFWAPFVLLGSAR